METSPITLIGNVGFNPASIVAAGRRFSVGRAILLSTPDTNEVATVVASQLGCETRVVLYPSSMLALKEIEECVQAAALPNVSDHIVFDMTGGTKVMAAGTWTTLVGLGIEKLDAVYLEQDGQMTLATDGRALDQCFGIKINEVLAWHGATSRSASWQGKLSAMPKRQIDGAGFGLHLFRLYGSRATVKISSRTIDGRDFDYLSVKGADGKLPKKLPSWIERVDASTVRTPVCNYFSKNAWLEELCLDRARKVLGDCARTNAAAGLHIDTLNGGFHDEADTVLVRGSRVCIIEAKARLSGPGAGADLQKRIQKTTRMFGALAHVIFVHPSWGASPPKSLVDLTVRGATLVASDIQVLDRAIAKSLLTGAEFDQWVRNTQPSPKRRSSTDGDRKRSAGSQAETAVALAFKNAGQCPNDQRDGGNVDDRP